MCKKFSKRCVGAKKSIPKNHDRVDEPFSPMDEKAAKMEELSAVMREAGVQGDLRRREDVSSMFDGDDDEDENEEDSYEHEQLVRKKTFAPPGYAKNSHEKEEDEL